MFADNDVSRPRAHHVFGFDEAAFRFATFKVGRQRKPELKALQTLHLPRRHFLTVPDAPTGAHPLNAAISNYSRATCRVVVAHVALGENRRGSDTRMGMKWHFADFIESRIIHIDDVEEHEGFQSLAEVRRAHQPRDGTATLAAGPFHDAPLRWRGVYCIRTGHRISCFP